MNTAGGVALRLLRHHIDDVVLVLKLPFMQGVQRQRFLRSR